MNEWAVESCMAVARELMPNVKDYRGRTSDFRQAGLARIRPPVHPLVGQNHTYKNPQND